MNQKPRFLPLLLSLLLVSLGGAHQATAQEPAETPVEGGQSANPRPFIDVMNVTVVNVDVYVTDSKGERVAGLTVDDFEITEDDRPVAITNFYAVESGQPVDGAVETEPQEPGEEPRDPRLAPRRLTVPEDQRLHLVLYFDNQFLRPFNRNRVVRRVREFLRTHVGPQDQVMMVTYDRELHRRQKFTADMRLVSDALDEIETVSAAAPASETARRDVIRRVDQSRDLAEAMSHVDFYAKSRYHDLGLSIDALKKLVGSLAGLPGRKALLYVSDGIPLNAGEDLFYLLDQRYPNRISSKLLANRYSARTRYQELIAQANANRVTFYTLEAAGLGFHSSLSAEQGGSASPTGGSEIDIDFVRDTNTQMTLMMMARDTGGLATFNTNNITGALDSMAADFGTYYSLGYQPVQRLEGRYHKIEVKVKRRGLKVRHRNGYRDKTAEVQVSEGTLASLFYGWESNRLGIELQAEGGGERQDNGNYLIPIKVRIPLGQATLIPQDELHHGKLQVSVAVIDEEGRVSSVQQTLVPLEIPNSEIEVARTKFFVYEAALLMRAGYQEVAVGVRDDFSGEASFVRQSLVAGGRATTAASLPATGTE
ncbi:MAG: VWA domain-containing protein [bacterium]|nr:VWA domain-containing protein [bacterium]